jgi:O-antigen ligase
LWLPLGGIAIGQRFLLPGVSIADVCVGVFILLALWTMREEPWRFPDWAPWLAAFCAWAIVSGAWVAATDPAFSAREYAKSLAKLLCYAAAALMVARAVRLAGLPAAVRVAALSFAAAAAVAIALYAAMSVKAPLPYELICGTADPRCESAYYFELRWFGDNTARSFREGVHLRALGLAGEPARLGVVMGLALGFLLLGPRTRPPILAASVVAIAAVLTFSLSAYALLLPVLALFAWRLLRAARTRSRWVWAAPVVLVGVACLPPVSRTLHRSIVVRSQRILEGRADSSARLRVIGSWDLALLLARHHPLTGVGLGNFDVRVRREAALVPGGHMVDDSVQGWNAAAYVVATTGAVGLLLFLLTGYAALRPSPSLGLVFLLGTFADGTVLGPAFWVFLALYAAAARDEGLTAPEGSPS